MQILHSYLTYTDKLLDVFFLLLAEILSGRPTGKEGRMSYREKNIEQKLFGTLS